MREAFYCQRSAVAQFSKALRLQADLLRVKCLSRRIEPLVSVATTTGGQIASGGRRGFALSFRLSRDNWPLGGVSISENDAEAHNPVGSDEMLGRVLGTEGATLLGYWIGVAPGQYFQLDDVVAADRDPRPGGHATGRGW
jgi:hypothetical protein